MTKHNNAGPGIITPGCNGVRPKLLDLFSGAGGCSYGYYLAGFEVVGVDIANQPHYPFEFHQDDALQVLDTLLSGDAWHGYTLNEFDAIHVSPPCQAHTQMLNNNPSAKESHIDLIDPVRERLVATGKPYIIENVVSAPVQNPVMLCGAMFGLRVYRHRLFESNILLFQPHHPRHKEKAAHAGTTPKHDEFYCPVGHFADLPGSLKAMGIDWMKTKYELAQAIPPAYTRFIGEQLRAYIDNAQSEVA